jgi:hypothetical protein
LYAFENREDPLHCLGAQRKSRPCLEGKGQGSSRPGVPRPLAQYLALQTQAASDFDEQLNLDLKPIENNYEKIMCCHKTKAGKQILLKSHGSFSFWDALSWRERGYLLPMLHVLPRTAISILACHSRGCGHCSHTNLD